MWKILYNRFKIRVSSLVIDEFSFTDGGNSVGGLVTSDCKPEPTPTPIKPTPTPIKPTPTPEPVSADCNCGDENTTNVTIAGAMVRQIVISLLDFRWEVWLVTILRHLKQRELRVQSN